MQHTSLPVDIRPQAVFLHFIMLEDIGNTLREARENRGITLQEAAEATFIRPHHLKALEKGDFSSMASAAQVRGFLRAYADYLGLDGQKIILATERQHTIASDEVIEETQPVTISEPAERHHEADAIFTEIGALLCERRELLGLSLDDVEQHTHIHKHYLKLLEAGQMEQFPSPVQARGMLSNYTAFLDLHPDRIMLRYADGLQARLEARQPERRHSEPRPETQPRPRPVWLRSLLSPDVLLVFFVAIGAILFGIWAFGKVMALQASEEPQPTAPSLAGQLLPSSTPTATPPITATPGADAGDPANDTAAAGEGEEAALGENPGSVQVNVIAQHRAYLKITVDGEVQLDQRVVPGSAYSYSANESIEILTGDGAAIQVMYNQTNLGPLGILGEVVNVVYTSQGVQTPTSEPTATTDPNATPTPTPSPTITPEPTEAAPE